MSTGTSRFQPGDVVGQYRLDRELGRGGMAVIFSATGPKDRKVAIKLLQSGFEQSPAVVERFEREGQILRALRHENIARVLEVASLPDRTLYLVIELLEGSDLRQMIDSRGPLSLRTAIQYMVGAASGVAEAHRQGIVHRDLKPANIFISMSGSGQRAVKVLDFGVAKLLAGREEITQTTEMFGAIHYQAPELLTGSNKAQPTADVWALGIVLYHALTCRLPFNRPTIGALCAAISKETPQPIRELRPDVTPKSNESSRAASRRSPRNALPTLESSRTPSSRSCPKSIGSPISTRTPAGSSKSRRRSSSLPLMRSRSALLSTRSRGVLGPGRSLVRRGPLRRRRRRTRGASSGSG